MIFHKPFDAHVHFRQGDMLRAIVPATASQFAGALIMPNVDPPITNLARLMEYRDEVRAAVDAAGEGPFQACYTCYLTPEMTTGDLEEMRPHLTAAKLYPKGLTTNSEHGIHLDDSATLHRLFCALEALDLPLCVHGEVHGYDAWHRERAMAPYYRDWLDRYPKLRIVMEHITTKELVDLLLSKERLHATITPHHLLCTIDDLLGDQLNPHLFCKPILKGLGDQRALRRAVESPRCMLGTDSAPHDKRRKNSDCCPAGVFSAPIALRVLAAWYPHPVCLQDFVSDRARKFYGLELMPKSVDVSEPVEVPQRWPGSIPIQPWLAGQTV